MSGVTLYCFKCHTNHHITDGQAEIVIHTLVAEWAEAVTDGINDIYAGEPGWEVTYDWCAMNHLNWVQDGEAYSEHIEAVVESRRASAGLGTPNGANQ